MRLAVAIAGENAPPSAFVVWRGFEESMRKASELGYGGVELALATAQDVDAEELARGLDRWNLGVSCISTGQVFAVLGLYFTHPDPDVRRQAIRVFGGLVNLAKDFGQTVSVGRARGFVSASQSREEAESLFIDTMRRISDVAGPLGVSLLIEPVNRYESNFVNTLDEGTALLKKIDRPLLGLLSDVFHMNIEEARIGECLARKREFIRYIHLADSNRLAPGQGHVDFDDVFNGLLAARFDGWAAVEILPKPGPDTAARQAARFMLPRIRDYTQLIQSASAAV